MTPEDARAEEAAAMERVVVATQRVQTTFTSLQKLFPPLGSGQLSPLALQTFDAALQELEEAQAEFDRLLNDLFDGER